MGIIPFSGKEAANLNRKLGRLLQPNVSVYLIVLMIFAVLAAAWGEIMLALAELAVSAILLMFYLMSRKRRNRQLAEYLDKELEEGNVASKPPFPMCVVRLADGEVIFANDGFVALTQYQDAMASHTVEQLLPGFNTEWLSAGKTEYPFDVTIERRRYRVCGSVIRADDPQATRLGVLYFTDLTELYQVRDEYIRSRPVVSIILVDNYEELTKNLTEGATSALNARINEAITKWTEDYHGLLRRLERNRFLFIFEKRDLKHAMAQKFSLLEDIHEITSPSGLPVSVSIGVGVDGETFEESYEFAALAIEMSLSRGGDQAVIKDRLNFNFYGGRNRETEQRSKVRSRVTSNSLMELIGGSSQVFVMGHRDADLDAVGAAMGICCLCRKKGKSVHIVMDANNNAAQNLIEEIREVPEYKDVFISGQEAMIQCDQHSILVVVDTNRPDQVEFKPLLEAVPKVCVVDHHRRAADYIKPVVVNLHEPYASSASELVTELLEYAVEKDDVLPIEAKSLLAGIFLDTKSFHVRTGERTFEAAAFLRQLGADTVEVKMLLQNDFDQFKAKYEIFQAARNYRDDLLIAALNKSISRALAAQAADELLNVSGITTSFVLYPDEDRVIISGRSIGDANVQMILEPLGGGGNTATAGAQMKNTTVTDALNQLVASIDRFYEE